MRKLLFLVLTLTIGCFAQAQDTEGSIKPVQLKVNTTIMPIKHVVVVAPLQIKATTTAGIFVMKHSRVKRALSFKITTKNPKLV